MATVTTEARWWHLEGKRVVCDLCPRECHLGEGQRAFCFVRQNVGGKMDLTTYGKSTGFCIDPIEKKPLNHFLPGTPVLSFGTAGCNLGCKFCQNWDISKAREIERLSDNATPETIARVAHELGCRSVAFTYNDPVIWAEYAIDTARCCRELGIKTVAVTAGYIQPGAREEFYSVMDAANVDLKAFTEAFYKYLTFSRLQPVLDTLRWLKHESDVWFEITNLLIPQENDSAEEVARMCDWILENVGPDVPVHFTAFHPDFRLRDRPHTPHETLIRAYDQAKAAGIHYAYIGNVYDARRQSTYCPNCGELLIERDWHELGVYRMIENHCAHCDALIPGVFEVRPGNWGRKRVPIHIDDSRTASRQEPEVYTIGRSPVAAPAKVMGSEVLDGCPAGAAAPLGSGPVVAVSPPPAAPRIDFSSPEQEQIASFTRRMVEASVRGASEVQGLPRKLAEAPAFGVFVTLTRRGLLRACRGQWGGTHMLDELLSNAAYDAAVNDQRFPSIRPEELPFLEVEVSLMFDPQRVTARGEERVGAVEVGRHGLVLNHPRGRGLLLPQVAVHGGWDAGTFLDHLCHKANLPLGAWRDEGAELMTFQARLLDSHPAETELDPTGLDGEFAEHLLEVADRELSGEPVEPMGEADPISQTHVEPLGVFLRVASGRHAVSVAPRKSVLDLVRSAARSLREDPTAQGNGGTVADSVALLWRPIPLVAAEHPARHQSLGRSAVHARTQGGWALVIPTEARRDAIQDALAAIRATAVDWQYDTARAITLTTFSTWTYQRSSPARVALPAANPLAAEREPNREPAIRPPARAGQFYPADPLTMSRQVERCLALGEGNKTEHRAIMLPHAGWDFCGSVIGKTLARTVVPSTVIVLGPKHTPYGPNWSVSSAEQWQIPGATVPIAGDLRERLLSSVPGLRSEAQAHQLEHGVEVLVPFLRHANPSVRILPVLMGAASYEETAPLAQALAQLIADQAQPPLLVISSDMNHFAPEPENRRRDMMALDAMRTGDPRVLFETVRAHDISMCGVLPAVTIMQALLLSPGPLTLEMVDYTNSGQVAGDMSRVVGYAGMLLD